jgi:hypothetical protein
MFRLQFGVPRTEFEMMCLAEMLDLVEYGRELNSGD